MAYIVPSDIKKIEFNQKNGGELETLEYLKKQLSDEYTVFHGVHWSREYSSWTHFGEIDFVILKKNGKLVFIEQKNGELDESTGKLIKFYANSSKDVADQIHRSIDKVREKFQYINGKDETFIIDYLIFCPDYKIKSINAAGINQSRTVDSTQKSLLAERIESLCDTTKSDIVNDYQILEQFFHQSFELVPDIHAHKDKLYKSFVKQSGALVSVLSNLEMEPFRLRINGTAGSGKSLVVQSFMEKELANNKRILFLCFNRLLAEKRKILWQQMKDNDSIIQTFYGFCSDFLMSQGIVLDFNKMTQEPDVFWQDILEQVMAMDIDESWQFDTLVVDEGQDFHEDWYEIAKLFLKEKASVLWLEDKEQKLTFSNSVKLEKFVTYNCRINYRSPQSIANFILKKLNVKFEIGNTLPGLGVNTHAYNEEDEQEKITAHLVQQLIKQGFEQDEIYIISCKGANNSIFSQLTKLGKLPLSHFTGEYNNNGEQIMTEGQLRFDSIYRFKGLEAPAIILVDVAYEKKLNTHQQHLLYCAMTRATVKLEILYHSNSSESQKLFSDL